MMNKEDYAICKILDVRFEYEDEPKALEVIDKILEKLDVKVQTLNQNKDE